MNWEQASEDYRRIEQAIHFLNQHRREQPSLAVIANEIGLSEYHFQRLFTRWAGVSPKRFLQYLTKEQAKKLLDQSSNLLDVTHATGLSSSARLHDLFVNSEAVTPGEYKQHGKGLEITYGIHPSPFGNCLLAVTDRGICSLYFLDDRGEEPARKALYQQWYAANIYRNQQATQSFAEQVFLYYTGRKHQPIKLHLIGTNFQLKVWEALLKVPMGEILSYEDLSLRIGARGATRAVGSALSRNQISILIPCHRVIRKIGEFGNYRWGGDRKRAMVAWEISRTSI